MSAFLSVHSGRPAVFDKSPRSRLLLCLSAALFCSSCNQSNITVYRIPKESVAIETGSGSLAPAPPSMFPKWTVPPDWKEQPLSEMRLANFKAEGANGESADISISSFPGDAAVIDANTNPRQGQ